MADTPTQVPISPRPQFLFRCRQCLFSSRSVTEAQEHWATFRHPYYAEAMPRQVVDQVLTQVPHATLPATPPAETLEDKLRLLNGLLEKVEDLALEASHLVDDDARLADSDVGAELLELALNAKEDQEDLDDLLLGLKEAATPVPAPAEVQS